MDSDTRQTLDMIERELDRQDEKGFDAQHDDQHVDGSIAFCARYVLEDLGEPDADLAAKKTDARSGMLAAAGVGTWPAHRAHRIYQKYKDQPLRRAKIAAALAAAECRRLYRVLLKSL